MAELAASAVSSLLAAIRDEALLLGGVRDDVQFIKEEMESMNSFLAHLARSAPPSGEHDDQVRAWKNQVRLFAQECNYCIDLYLYRCDPDIHVARGRLRRYLGWVPWFLHGLVAQHRAAVELRRLKGRGRDIAERRLRYAVEAPARLLPPSSEMAAGSSAVAAGGYAAADHNEDQLAVAMAAHPLVQRAVFDHPTLDEYLKAKLLEWASEIPPNAGETFSIAIVAPHADKHVLDCVLAVAQETLVVPHNLYGCGGYHRSILVNIPEVHHEFLPLRPKEVLYYILRELEHANSQPPQQGIDQGEEEEDYLDFWQVHLKRNRIYHAKKRELRGIKVKIEKMKIYEKLDKIKNGIQVQQQKSEGYQKRLLHLGVGQNKDVDQLDLDELLLLISQSVTSAASQPDEAKIKDKQILPAWDNNIISKIANKLKQHMEGDEEEEEVIDDYEESQIFLHKDQYAQIVQKAFMKTSSSKPLEAQRETRLEAKQAMKTLESKWDEEEIKRIILAANQEALRALQGGKGKHSDNDQAPCKPIQNPMDGFEGIVQKIEQIKQELKEQLKIKEIVDKINYHLNGECPLIIFKVDQMLDVSRWDEIRKALSLLQCSTDALIITTTESIQQAKGYCYPTREPIDYSLVGLYHDRVLDATSQKNKQNYSPQVVCDILEACVPHEFCMKIFTHALYANPTKSNEELIKLHQTLQDSPKSFYILAKKMFMYSYNDLPEEYQSCLLYLAIFPPEYKIRRSTLIGRWVAERLTFKEDWTSSVRHAQQCFDALIFRGLVSPADIGATGKVNSCVVGDLIHGFITPIATKKHFLEARLSHHLARRFSVFNDVQLRSRDGIYEFFEMLSKSSRVSLLKVLDLEGCYLGHKSHRYLKVICSKMLLLKYLSLRGTDITHLPSEINYLRQLEILDIRQTKVAEGVTRKILLLKLKRLLAGSIDPTQSNFTTSVWVPHRIGKMVNLEVLSNVKARCRDDLRDIGRQWQLRKLGVVINEDHHLRYLIQAISDLHECLSSLSITLPVAAPHGDEDTPSTVELPEYNGSRILCHPKILENLRISGTTLRGRLLPLFIRGDKNQLANVTLIHTLLDKKDLDMLAELPRLRCVRLQHIVCTEPMLTFKECKFSCLECLLVIDCSTITKIVFATRSAPRLEKIIWSSPTSLFGIENLLRLKELEFNGDDVPKEVEEAIKKHKNKPTIKHNKTQDQAKVDEEE